MTCSSPKLTSSRSATCSSMRSTAPPVTPATIEAGACFRPRRLRCGLTGDQLPVPANHLVIRAKAGNGTTGTYDYDTLGRLDKITTS